MNMVSRVLAKYWDCEESELNDPVREGAYTSRQADDLGYLFTATIEGKVPLNQEVRWWIHARVVVDGESWFVWLGKPRV